jgi:hypothetical protein
MGLSNIGSMPPSAKGPRIIPDTTNPIISGILKCIHNLPSNSAGKTRNNTPIIVGITSNSDTISITLNQFFNKINLQFS